MNKLHDIDDISNSNPRTDVHACFMKKFTPTTTATGCVPITLSVLVWGMISKYQISDLTYGMKEVHNLNDANL
jgi:hypothetical protein